MSLGAPELGIILLIVLVIFGGAKLPKLARSLGSAQREFKKGLDEESRDDDSKPRSPNVNPPAPNPGPSPN